MRTTVKSSREKREASRRRARPVVGVSEVAEHLGRSKTWVKEHAQELGGWKQDRKWCFQLKSIDYHIKRIDKRLATHLRRTA